MARHDLADIVQGADYEVTITVSNFDLTDHTAFGQIRETQDSTTITANFITSVVGQVITISLTHTTTDLLDFTKYHYDIFVDSAADTDETSIRKRILWGRVTAVKNVTVIT